MFSCDEIFSLKQFLFNFLQRDAPVRATPLRLGKVSEGKRVENFVAKTENKGKGGRENRRI